MGPIRPRAAAVRLRRRRVRGNIFDEDVELKSFRREPPGESLHAYMFKATLSITGLHVTGKRREVYAHPADRIADIP